MKKYLMLLFCLAVPVMAGDYVETSAGLQMLDSTAIVGSGINTAILTGAATWGNIIVDSMYWPPRMKYSLETHYITKIDTGYVFLRKNCDTTRVTIYEGDSTKPTEIRMDLNDCHNIYRYKIDTSWAELIVFRGTPEQIEKLMELLDK